VWSCKSHFSLILLLLLFTFSTSSLFFLTRCKVRVLAVNQTARQATDWHAQRCHVSHWFSTARNGSAAAAAYCVYMMIGIAWPITLLRAKSSPFFFSFYPPPHNIHPNFFFLEKEKL
jgi:hypothetical protein